MSKKERITFTCKKCGKPFSFERGRLVTRRQKQLCRACFATNMRFGLDDDFLTTV